ncbi:hypothetical protein [Auritidibacter ignavus]|uniref:hypothetical protein n=1 Tax=Auritidibacter ignavus TaxID=678932 RepID=UPI00244D2F68|nr:hypothetical protein [Auritidibacter ignavus]WGH84953.1 hypothetical protein QDX20_05440 [Auritidibacter ignavus]
MNSHGNVSRLNSTPPPQQQNPLPETPRSQRRHQQSAPSSPELPARRGDSLVLRGWRAVKYLFASDPFPEQLEDALEMCQAPVTSGRRIAVMSPVGGAGVSTLVALMARQFVSIRTEPIYAVELNHPLSAEAGLQRRIDPDPAENLTVVSEFATHPDDLDRECINDAFQYYAQNAAVTLFDLPPRLDLLEPLHHGLHELIIPVPCYPAAVEATEKFCTRVAAAYPELAMMPLLVDSYRTSRATRRDFWKMARHSRLEDHFAATRRRSLLTLRYDLHLVAGAPVQLSLLSEKARLQVASIAGRALKIATDGEL